MKLELKMCSFRPKQIENHTEKETGTFWFPGGNIILQINVVELKLASNLDKSLIYYSAFREL